MTTRMYLADELPSLLVPTRLTVFAERDVPKGRKGKLTRASVAWQGWNADPAMESRMARLAGSGSFYWPCAWQAYCAARQMFAADPTIHQIAVETISGREVARLYR